MPRSGAGALLARPAFLRYLGLFGAVCCAVDAFVYGAAPYIRRNVTVVSIFREPAGPAILLLWFAGLAALCTAWWYGRRLLRDGVLTPRWITVTAALWSAPLVFVPPLASRDMYANACQGALVDAGLNPYLVGVSAQPCPWLDSVSVVWRDTPTPYGPVFLVLAGLAAAFGSQAVALAGFRLLAVLGVAALAACLPVLARRAGVPVERALWLVLCCPLVPVHLIGGGHSDALTVAFMIAGFMVLAAPSRSWGALLAGGALLGLAVSTKITIGVVLPFAALFAVGGLRRAGWSALLRRGAALLAAALGVLAAASLASGLGFGWLTALSGAGESVNWSSPPTAVGLAAEAAGRWFGADLTVVPAVRAVALVLLGLSLLVILWRSRDRDPLAGAGLALLAVIFFAPITQPWYLTWPLALFAVSAARARWLAGTVVFAMATILPEGTGTFRPLGVPLSFAMVVLVIWVARRAVAWLRGVELAADDAIGAPAAKTSVAVP
ncbi:polyprenol phosphomannose-dependent alpha 1,6 mannosyltransferase MptB [Couchioplanes azureus]|uniref:polyprenol phosphomannose-dependent alpha 1,6 mannosyltransferase MptB n=1 Tax=Couchioplanes caeruleus TaxID=56438 RepID=UPI001671786D|nr:polyprenol phosphomannose-dependent alpha 1,6 mannosyltransferase MptB [Couchioplanes caeruleus]GGQ87202.1 putative alpha-(1->6)-mannopyranosyltransferase [Couchioplanes caeruleus subsp. azureus]